MRACVARGRVSHPTAAAGKGASAALSLRVRSSRTTQYAAVRALAPPGDPPSRVGMPEVPEGGICPLRSGRKELANPASLTPAH